MFPWRKIFNIHCKLYCYYSANSVKIISINYMDFLYKFLDKYVMVVTLFDLQASISYLFPDCISVTTDKLLMFLLLTKTV